MTPPSAPLPATAIAGLRIAVIALLPLAVQAGWIDAGTTVDAVLGVVVPLATAAYGLWKTHDRQTRLNNSAPIGRSVIRPKE